MNYLVRKNIHPQYQEVVMVEVLEHGNLNNPFQAINFALKEKRIWQEQSQNRIRLLVDNQVLTDQQAEEWAKEEYKLLPKCFECAKIIEDVFIHELSDEKFCSNKCANLNFFTQEYQNNLLEEVDL